MGALDAESLSRLGIRTVLDLGQARDLEALSAQSGVSLAQLREWQQLARREVTAARRRHVALFGATLFLVIGLVGLASNAPPPEVAPIGPYERAIALYDQNALVDAGQVLDSALAAGDDGAALHTFRGVIYRALGDTGAATREYQQALAIDSAYSHAWNNLGNIYLAHQDTARALDAYLQAVTYGGDKPLHHRNYASLLLATGRSSEAIGQYEAAIAADSSDTRSYSDLSDLYLTQGDTAAAEAVLREAIDRNPSSPAALAALGALFLERRAYSEAGAAYRSAAELAADSAQYWQETARAFRLEHQWDPAIAAYRRALRLEPDDWDTLFYLGWCLRQKGKPAGGEAIEAFNATLRAAPGDARNKWTYMNLAIEYAAMSGDTALTKSEAALARALEMDSDFAAAMMQWGYILDARGLMDSARAMYKRATRADSSNPLTYFTLGQSLLRAGEQNEARQVLRDLRRRAPDNQWTLLFEAKLLEAAERYGDALSANRLALKKFPQEPDIILSLSGAELTAGARYDDPDLIRTGLHRVEQLQMKDSSDYTQQLASFELAWAYQTISQIRDLSKAERLYEKTLTYSPRDLSTLNNLAVIALARGGFDRIIDLSRRVLEIQPRYADALENMAYGYQLKGDLKEAIVWYDSAAKLSQSPASVYMLRGESKLWLGNTAEAHRDFATAHSSLAGLLNDAGITWVRLLPGRYDKSGEPRVIYYYDFPEKHASIDLLDGAAYARENEEMRALKALRAATARLRRHNENDAEVVRMGLADLARLREEMPSAPAVRSANDYLASWLAVVR